MKNKYNAIDLTKLIASIFIIVVHTSPMLPYSKPGNFILINILGRLATPFFFIATAFFIKKNMIERGDQYLKKYIISLVKLYLIWSLIYLPLGIQWISLNIDIPWFLYPIALIVALFYIGTYFHLWFIPALIFSLLVVYYLKKYMSYKVLMIISFSLLCLGALESYYGVINNTLVLNVIDNYMNIFVTTRNGLFFGMFYVVCGYYIASNKMDTKYKHYGKLSIISFILVLIEAYSLYDTGSINFNILIMIGPFTYFLFNYLKGIELKWKLNYTLIRRYSNSFYFVHPIFVGLIPIILDIFGKADYYNNSGIFRLVTVLLGTIILSYIICNYKKILGWKKDKKDMVLLD
ncbi:MAG: acyltransferase [Erysipelotrichaceae bacterium]